VANTARDENFVSLEFHSRSSAIPETPSREIATNLIQGHMDSRREPFDDSDELWSV
jgi:hypothetical protein